MLEQQKYKYCPSCGGNKHDLAMHVEDVFDPDARKYTFYCMKCNFGGKNSDTIEGAFDNWNDACDEEVLKRATEVLNMAESYMGKLK